MKTMLAFSFAAVLGSSALGQTPAMDVHAVDHSIVVREVSSPRMISFKYLEKGVFKASNIRGSIRLRIFRGTKSEVLRDAKEHAVAGGCVRIQSLVVEPTVERSTVSMPFYFEVGWLEPVNNRIDDGAFTFVFEVPEEGWHLEDKERGSIQPVDIHTEVIERYFQAGITVTILAPVYRRDVVSSRERALADSTSQMIQTSVSISQAGSALIRQGTPPSTKTAMAVSCEGIQVAPPPYKLTLNGGDPMPSIAVAALR